MKLKTVSSLLVEYSLLALLFVFISSTISLVTSQTTTTDTTTDTTTTTTTTSAPPATTTTTTTTFNASNSSSNSTNGTSTTTTTTTTPATTTLATTTATGNQSGNGTTPSPSGAAATAERQALQWYHVAVAVAIGFLLAFGTCYAICVWQQTAVRDYEGGLENFLKEVGLLRRQLADEVEEREELAAKQGGVNDLFEKYKTEQELIQAEAERKESIRRNLAVSGAGDEKDGKDGKDAAAKAKPGQSDAVAAVASRTANMISFRQQRAQEIKNLQALSRVGSTLGPVGGTGRFQTEPESRYQLDPRSAANFRTTRNVVQLMAETNAPRAFTITDPLQLALSDALNTQRTLSLLRTSGQMRSLQTGSEL
jgi:hypothetical protein